MSEKNQTKGSRMVVFDLTSNQCVWSKAGVSQPRVCHNAFDCTTCAFDKKVQREFKDLKGERASRRLDKKRYGTAPFEDRKCRYMLSGQVSLKYCVRGFNCANCEYDQMMEETGLAMACQDPSCEFVAGFAVPEDYYFHKGHTWGRVEYGGWVRIGLDDFAVRLLGPLNALRLPKLGMAVREGEAGFDLSREEHQAALQSPVDGVVVAVNPEVNTSAQATHSHPYGQGWLFMVKPTRLLPNLGHLFSGESAHNWMEEEAHRLYSLVEGTTGRKLASTGGRAIDDIYGKVPGLDWERLVRDFLNP